MHPRALVLGLASFASLASAQGFPDSSTNWNWQIHGYGSAYLWDANKNSAPLRTLTNFTQQISAEDALMWENMPSLLHMSIKGDYSLGGFWQLYFEGDVQRDIESWYLDPLGINTPYKPNELDLNIPKEAWIDWSGGPLEMRIGRFKTHEGPSESRSVALSGNMAMDGFRADLRLGLGAHYRFLMYSLNPWLSPTEDSLQNLASAPNQRGIIYNQFSKNLIMHRLDWEWPSFQFGISEHAMIGGKDLSLRDASPLVLWHNNFGDGYTNSFWSTDFCSRTDWGKFYGEMSIDDILSPVGEGNHGDKRIVAAYNLGYEKQWITNWGTWLIRPEFVYVDPEYGSYSLPLLRQTDRILYKSNRTAIGDPNFVDTYVADIPLGYDRGPDVLDYWLDLQWTKSNSKIILTSGWLSQGDISLDSARDYGQAMPYAPYGKVRQEWREDLHLSQSLWSHLELETWIQRRQYFNLAPLTTVILGMGFKGTF